MDSPAATSPCSNKSGKRRRDSPLDERPETQLHPVRISRAPCSSDSLEKNDSDEEKTQMSSCSTSTSRSHRHQHFGDFGLGHANMTKEQSGLLQRWYKGFARPEVAPTLHDDRIVAFATAIRSEPRLVINYVRQRRNSNDTMKRIAEDQDTEESPPRSGKKEDPTPEPYTLTTANKHLPPTILPIVERYVSGCRRRRSQNDGRRSVNTGPYRCTFGCGYRTKRAFDWRRHEETHEPQELWLCDICGQTDSHNPFLVNRKDKFMKHVADKHAEVAADTVLDKSKLEFVPRTELGCRYCGEESASWDERCRHVLGHFEVEVEKSMKRVKVVHEEPDNDRELFPGECSNVASSEKIRTGVPDILN
ncbi:hypothetical protein HBI23_129050 [Parastagonospora nodorum]|nr:hypothetical protein HBI12_071970 [Parastagonospora nodorum]KAH5442452.1 hypothetical protein HBI47_028560 [Parastagonospora nodorum]KAH5660112.1 hypothetical protein HBI23_129050 [Parastagonospora nodorum]